MFYVFLSICFSVVVSIFLKLARRYQIDVFQAITWNYSIAILLTWVIYRPQLPHLQAAPLLNYTLLGFLFPALFIVIAAAVKNTGIVRTDVAQRLSLFIPLVAAFLLFGEKPTLIRVIGIALGFAAIICSIPWGKRDLNGRKSGNSWIYLLVVFVGMGVIDILLKQVAAFKAVPFATSLFIIFILAFVISLLRLFYLLSTKKIKFSWPHIVFGWILGIANFGNILFYIKAHQVLANNPSIVFSAMNIGVITLGTIVGLFVFKERLSRLNKAGIVLAIIAIVVIYYPEFFQKIFS
ncbi:MAG: transporter [Mucilaginibacter sp.]|nr:transporter [Mucilaginibacter sp.]